MLQPPEKPPTRLEQALAWLEAHPEHWDTASRQLEGLIGVSHMTINRAQRQLRAAKGAVVSKGPK